MEHLIKVKYRLVSNPETVFQIPIRYHIVEDVEHCIKTVHCYVDLPERAIPSWLHPTSFEMVNHYQSGLHMIYYKDKEEISIDVEFFRYKLYAEIMLVERLKEGRKMEHC